MAVTETYNLEDTDLRLYRNVPIADGMVPIWQSPEEQYQNWQKYRVANTRNTLYINGSSGNIQLTIDPKLIIGCDYISFINHYFENKIYYARITNTEVVTNGITHIDFQIDNFQTYMFDFKMRGGVVLREHLTEADHQKALDNPWRDDVPELFTDEGFSLTSAEEVKYKRPRDTYVSKQFGTPKLGDSNYYYYQNNALEPDGIDGLVTTLGGDVMYHSTYSNDPGTLTHGNIRNTYIIAEVTSDLASAYRRWVDDGKLRSHNDYQTLDLVTSKGLNPTPTFIHLILLARPGENTTRAVEDFINLTAREGHSPDLIKVVEIPKSVFENSVDLLERKANRTTKATHTPPLSENVHKLTKNPSHHINVPKYSDLYGHINPKLERFPFRYIRVNAPDGSDKEFVIEKFGPHGPAVNMYGEIIGEPALHVLPIDYAGHSADVSNRLTADGYPTLPAETSGYINYIRNRAVAALEGETQNARRARDMTELSNAKRSNFNLFNPGTWLPAIQGAAESLGGAASMVKHTLTGDPQQGLIEQGQSRFERMQLEQAEEIVNGNMPTETFTGEQAPGGTFAVPRGITAGMGEYTPGNYDNRFLYALNRMHFEIVVVTYQREVIKSYSDFLDAYGYRADSVAQPRVMDYIRGGVGPRFVNMDGLTFTYAQTEGIKIYGVTPTAAADIAAVFNGGARFTKGF